MTDPFSTYADDLRRAAGVPDLDIPKSAAERYNRLSARETERNRLLSMFESSRQVNLTQIREAVIFLLKGDLA